MEERVWITGAGGLIGNQLVQSASRWVPQWSVRGLTRAELDLTNASAVKTLFNQERPSMVIHCAAISKSPASDANRDLAWRTNVEATRCLVEAAAEAQFVFFSSDLIFDGRKGGYVEEDPANPLMYYGETKLRGEEIVREHSRHTIFRISLTGGASPTRDRGFNEEMKKAWQEEKTLNLFTDEYRCPMAAEITARAVWEMVSKEETGTFHLCGAEKLSRYEIGTLLAGRHPEFGDLIRPGSRRDYQGPPRPEDTSMSIAKIQPLLSFSIPSFSDWLRADTSGF